VPEGHSLHRLARDQQELVGTVVRASSPQGKFAAGATAVDGHAIVAIEAVGKHLLQRFDGGVGTVHVHLGMQGKYFRSAPPTGEPLKQVRLRLANVAVAWDLVAPSTTELVDDDQVQELRDSLGPDPLQPGYDRQRTIDNLLQSNATIGEALLDQRRIAGVGNVFRAEALLRVHVHPATRASDLTDEQAHDLLDVLERMMKQAVDDGEITPKLVYKQPSCRQCDTDPPTPVETFDLHGRTAYACPTCQGVP
jgi:formamidopyrimidine-DNA glycosylase